MKSIRLWSLVCGAVMVTSIPSLANPAQAVSVEEVLKGEPGEATLAIEGGTVNGITMRVSSLPSLSKGERGVFFLTPGRGGEFRPHLRGQGILKLKENDRVSGSTLTLGDIRRSTRAAGK